jgi:hypothetical protein
MPSQSSYANLVCCTGDATLANTCSGTFQTFLKLSSTTNAHVERGTQSNYANSACLSLSTGTVSVGYQASNCTGFDTTILSMSTSAVTNSHVGDPSTYTTKVCGSTNIPQSLSVAISTSTVGFGTLSNGASTYATAPPAGSGSEVEAHTIAVTTNAASGYAMTVKGATLNSSALTINAIGGTNTAPAVGTEQFGLRMTASGGVGTTTSPYAASGFAYAATATTTSQVSSAATGDGVQTTYSVRYLGNIAPNTEPAAYSTFLTYTTTANF